LVAHSILLPMAIWVICPFLMLFAGVGYASWSFAKKLVCCESVTFPRSLACYGS
jgi:hypothetical protein